MIEGHWTIIKRGTLETLYTAHLVLRRKPIMRAGRKFAAATALISDVNAPVRDADPVVNGEPAVPS